MIFIPFSQCTMIIIKRKGSKFEFHLKKKISFTLLFIYLTFYFINLGKRKH